MERRVKTIASIALSALLGLGAFTPVEGQVTVTAGLVETKGLGGQYGGDLRVWIEPPFTPVGVYLGTDYYLADCPEDCSLWGWRAGGYLHWGLPVLQPYLTGAYVVRELDLDGRRSGNVGLAMGIGARLTQPIELFAEASWEIFGNSLDGWSLRFGIGL